MKLKEYQVKYGIKRIDFDKINAKDTADTEYGNDEMYCPYCGEKIEFESEDINNILGGTSWECPKCGKNFFVEGEITVSTTTYAMGDFVRSNRKYIEGNYKHIDECDEKGVEFGQRYGCVEWDTYIKYARPLFENEKLFREE